MRREYIDSMPDLHATWLSRLQRRWDATLQALPSQCAICGRWPGQRLCADCRARWAQALPRCALCARQLPPHAPAVCGACLRHPPRLARCIAVLDYAYPWRQVIADFKFHADLGLARSLGALLAFHAAALQMLQECDALLPVPASPQRLRERGFDHTLLLARALRPPALWHRAVLRRHTAQAQHELPRAQRLRQLRHAFSVAPGWHERVAARKLVLLDDVMTTGATLDALAGCLLRAGAASVSALVLARTP